MVDLSEEARAATRCVACARTGACPLTHGEFAQAETFVSTSFIPSIEPQMQAVHKTKPLTMAIAVVQLRGHVLVHRMTPVTTKSIE